MIPLLRLLSYLIPFAGIATFILLAVTTGNPNNLSEVGMAVLVASILLAMGGMLWAVHSMKAEENDGRLGEALSLGISQLKIRFLTMFRWRRIFDIVFGERGPADIVVTRSEQGIRFRLPNRWRDREKWTPWLLAAVVFGPILILVTISATMGLPAEERDVLKMVFLALALLTAMVTIVYKWRAVWHYELLLMPNELLVFYCTWGQVQFSNRLDLAPIRQFTVIHAKGAASLQAESLTGPLQLIVRDADHEIVQQLAQFLAEEFAVLAPERPKMRVAVEMPGQETTERAAAPLNSKILLTRHETGVTLDFPLAEEYRIQDRRSAWNLLKVSMGIWLASVLWLGGCLILDQQDLSGLAVVSFLAGVFSLLAAASKAWTATNDTRQKDDLRQLSVAGGMLIRSSRDHRKQVWYRQEIGTIAIETIDTEEGPNLLQLVLKRLGEPVIMCGPIADLSAEDYRPKAELEWIGTQLRQALVLAPAESASPFKERASSEAITQTPEQARETHITT